MARVAFEEKREWPFSLAGEKKKHGPQFTRLDARLLTLLRRGFLGGGVYCKLQSDIISNHNGRRRSERCRARDEEKSLDDLSESFI